MKDDTRRLLHHISNPPAPKHPKRPCAKCPYRKDAPLGLWHEDHYLSVIESEGAPVGAVFHCHSHGKLPKEQRGLCAGWLLDQKNRGMPSVGLRLLASRNAAIHKAFDVVTSTVPMFASAIEMAVANVRFIINQSRNARNARNE